MLYSARFFSAPETRRFDVRIIAIADDNLYKKVEKGTEEKEASYFAAALLMPRASFSLKYKKCKQSGVFGNALLFRLSAIYKAPLEIVAFRIEAIEEMKKDNDNV